MAENKSVNLYFREGSSDKVYQAQLSERPDGWAVTFQYGRRGKPLTSGEKGSGLDFESADQIYNKLVLSKTSKGYTPNEDGVAFSAGALSEAGVQRAHTGFRAQLYNEVSHQDLDTLDGDAWLVQRKFDGERRPMLATGDDVKFANRQGLESTVSAPVEAAFKRLAEIEGALELDAEDMGDHVAIFDVKAHPMIQDGTFRERAAILAHLKKTIEDAGLQDALRVELPESLAAIRARDGVGALREAGEEGIVLRHVDSVYTPGKPASGGDAFKLKFWDDITCRVVEGREGKSSVGIALLDADGAWQQVGNVTIPSNAQKPEPGALIDVKYLYAYPGGSLFQPTFRGERKDVDESECRIDRLKFVASAPQAEATEPTM